MKGKSVPPTDAHTSGDVPPPHPPITPAHATGLKALGEKKDRRVIQWDNDYCGDWKWGEGGKEVCSGMPMCILLGTLVFETRSSPTLTPPSPNSPKFFQSECWP